MALPDARRLWDAGPRLAYGYPSGEVTMGPADAAHKLPPSSRSHRLRDAYWQDSFLAALHSRQVPASGRRDLVGYAENFAALLDASEPFIAPDELIVGAVLAIPESGADLELGFYNAHFSPGHRRILATGLPGMRDLALERLRGEEDPDKRGFLESVAISYDAACRFARRHADLATEQAARETVPARVADLERIAAVCSELAQGPPTSFHAALQLVQLTRVFGAEGAMGRLDQWLYPFYERDVDAGALDSVGAQQLLECFFIKCNEFLLDVPRGYLPAGLEFQPNDSLRNITLAGQTSEGEDACNELTYLCLRAAASLRLPEPKLNVRFFGGTPHRLLVECCRLLAAGVNVLAVFNDDVAIPALTELGIPIEEARDYCNDGCAELIIDGRTFTRFAVHDALTVLRETVSHTPTDDFPTFDYVMDDIRSRMGRLVPQTVPPSGAITFPFFAASMDDCFDEASPDGIRYTIWGSILGEVGNAADGLAAIQSLIYQQGELTWDELQSALDADYVGYEPLRQRLRNRTPKYGNDNDGADLITKSIAEHFCDCVHRSPRGERGASRAAGFMLFGIEHKRDLPASPDGRRQGDPTANSFSPSVGMDRSGPTAVLRSASKIDLTRAAHGSVLDLALDAHCVQDAAGFQGLVSLVQGFLDQPSTATLQMNVLDREVLLRALQNPDAPEFRSLIVRVWGFSAVFVDLAPALQEHVLARTAHRWNA